MAHTNLTPESKAKQIVNHTSKSLTANVAQAELLYEEAVRRMATESADAQQRLKEGHAESFFLNVHGYAYNVIEAYARLDQARKDLREFQLYVEFLGDK